MVEETEDNWWKCVDQALELAPECLTIYQMEVPYNTGIYKQMQAEGKLVAPVADWPTKRRWVSDAFAKFEAAGYEISSATTVVKSKEKVKFLYRDALWAGADLLPLGVASFGHLGGTHIQNHADIGPYCLLVQNGQLPTYRAYLTNAEERYRREFMLTLKLGRVSADYFVKKFGQDPRETFAAELAGFHAQDLGGVEGDAIYLTREGLMQVDRLLHELFLPQHRGARYT
jgi:oxygen-independent coproporphyrinogen-3 oxidase